VTGGTTALVSMVCVFVSLPDRATIVYRPSASVSGVSVIVGGLTA